MLQPRRYKTYFNLHIISFFCDILHEKHILKYIHTEYNSAICVSVSGDCEEKEINYLPTYLPSPLTCLPTDITRGKKCGEFLRGSSCASIGILPQFPADQPDCMKHHFLFLIIFLCEILGWWFSFFFSFGFVRGYIMVWFPSPLPSLPPSPPDICGSSSPVLSCPVPSVFPSPILFL